MPIFSHDRRVRRDFFNSVLCALRVPAVKNPIILRGDADVEPQEKIVDTEPAYGHFNDRSVVDHRRNLDCYRSLFFDGPLSIAADAGKEPVAS